MNDRDEQETAAIEDLPETVPKLCGADVELGNFVEGRATEWRETGTAAARALLREIEGQPHTVGYSCHREVGAYASQCSSSYRNYYGGALDCQSGNRYRYDPQDWGRKYLRTNGGCAYIDLGHLELCIPELLSAYDHVACSRAMLFVARQAQVSANEKLPVGERIRVLANNSDGQGNSFGSHLNVLTTRHTWEDIFHVKVHYMLFLAAYQVSSIVFTGQGKVGSENGRPATDFQISARADFFETLVGSQTTYRRPIVNARDEALCGPGAFSDGPRCAKRLARLHVIFFDNTLCQVASLLKVGVLQIVVAMIEQERVNPELILDNPVQALLVWSHDPTLRAQAKTMHGRQVTAVELQMLFFEEASRFVECGGCEGVVPRAREILALWGDTLEKLKEAASTGESGALTPLAPRLDWVLKQGMLRRAMAQRPELTWSSPTVKHLDHLYSSIDPGDGLYWAYERSGLVEQVVSEAQIERFIHEPPADTRAWTRAMLLRLARPEVIASVDWDQIRFKLSDDEGYWPRYRTLNMDNPLAFTKAACEQVFREEVELDHVLDMLGAPQRDRSESTTTSRFGADEDDSSLPFMEVSDTAAAGRPDAEIDVHNTLEEEGGQNHEVQ